MIYGYESTLSKSESVQTLDDLAIGFMEALSYLSGASIRRRILIIAHSLGGLIVKQVKIKTKLDCCF